MLRTMRPLILILILCLSAGLLLTKEARGFRSSLGAEENCSACHTLTLEEASSIISSLNPSIEVLGVAMGPVEGLWEVVIEARGKKGIAYIDFSKEHIITGSILKILTKENLTSLKLYELSKIDLSMIPLDQALVMGKEDAKYRVVVFDDPD